MTGGIKRTPADDWFSKCVRERTNWICEKCGKNCQHNHAALQCSHSFSRRHRTIRWCGENAQALCFTCHRWYEGNPPESGKWLENKILGTEMLEILIEKKNNKVKVPKIEEKKIAKHYKAEYEKMQEKRANGVTGRIEFDSWQ